MESMVIVSTIINLTIHRTIESTVAFEIEHLQRHHDLVSIMPVRPLEG